MFFFLDVSPYGGSVMDSQIVVMGQMNLRPVLSAVAPLDSSSVRIKTVLTLGFSAMATQTALTTQMRTLLSAVKPFVSFSDIYQMRGYSC